MSFFGVIDSNRHKQIWSKSIMSLAAISDHIKFIVSTDSLSISAVNNAKTSHAEIIFKKTFFHEYLVDFTNVLTEGFEKEVRSDGGNEEDSETVSYSFLVNSKHLATLFKTLDAGDLEYICFKIYWSTDAPSAMKYKLLVEIKTKKLIIKKYQTNYQPVLKKKLKVASIYSQELFNQQEMDGEFDARINYMMVEQIILKQFLDMIPSTTEDFKIDIKNEKISFSGYTKQIMKDREYLKQPMSVTITLNLDELVNTNLSKHDDNGESFRKAINFRLKDFKNFMNLVSSFNSTGSSESNEDDYISLNNIANEDNFEIFFKSPGDPVLFELKNNPHVVIQYVQITSEDNDITIDYANQTRVNAKDLKKNKEKLMLPSHVIHKIHNDSNDHQHSSVLTSLSASSNLVASTRLKDQHWRRAMPRQEQMEYSRRSVSNSRLKPTEKNKSETNPEYTVGVPFPSQKHSSNVPSSFEGAADIVTYQRAVTPNMDSPNKRLKVSLNESNDLGIINIDMQSLNNMFIPDKIKARNPPGKQTNKEISKRMIINHDEETDYSDADDDNNEKPKSDDEILGPTQVNDRPKSIFD